MNKLGNLLIVAGTGRKSGKTTLACNIIKQFSEAEPLALKISPHFHEASAGLEILKSDPDFNIYRELSERGDKDSSKMLISGASAAYYIQVYDNNAGRAFRWLIDYLNTTKPIVCESPALRRFVEPGVFIIADSDNIVNKKDLSDINVYADFVFNMGSSYDKLHLSFDGTSWFFNK
jgi:hypothetical protein